MNFCKMALSGNCRDCYASSCTAGGRQCNCRRNWRFITATPKDPKIEMLIFRSNISRASRVEGVAQTVADEVDAQHGQHDHHPREQP
jgi:hypothetical protein